MSQQLVTVTEFGTRLVENLRAFRDQTAPGKRVAEAAWLTEFEAFTTARLPLRIVVPTGSLERLSPLARRVLRFLVSEGHPVMFGRIWAGCAEAKVPTRRAIDELIEVGLVRQQGIRRGQTIHLVGVPPVEALADPPVTTIVAPPVRGSSPLSAAVDRREAKETRAPASKSSKPGTHFSSLANSHVPIEAPKPKAEPRPAPVVDPALEWLQARVLSVLKSGVSYDRRELWRSLNAKGPEVTVEAVEAAVEALARVAVIERIPMVRSVRYRAYHTRSSRDGGDSGEE